MDQLFRLAGRGLLFPGALGSRIERGYRYAEVERTIHRVKTFRRNARERARTAGELEDWAQEAEKKATASRRATSSMAPRSITAARNRRSITTPM